MLSARFVNLTVNFRKTILYLGEGHMWPATWCYCKDPVEFQLIMQLIFKFSYFVLAFMRKNNVEYYLKRPDIFQWKISKPRLNILLFIYFTIHFDQCHHHKHHFKHLWEGIANRQTSASVQISMPRNFDSKHGRQPFEYFREVIFFFHCFQFVLELSARTTTYSVRRMTELLDAGTQIPVMLFGVLTITSAVFIH